MLNHFVHYFLRWLICCVTFTAECFTTTHMFMTLTAFPNNLAGTCIYFCNYTCVKIENISIVTKVAKRWRFSNFKCSQTNKYYCILSFYRPFTDYNGTNYVYKASCYRRQISYELSKTVYIQDSRTRLCVLWWSWTFNAGDDCIIVWNYCIR